MQPQKLQSHHFNAPTEITISLFQYISDLDSMIRKYIDSDQIL